MFRREDIRYGNFWVRLVCCLAVAIAVANGVHFRVLQAWEAVAHDLVLGDDAGAFAGVTKLVEIFIVFFACLAPSLLRIERPVVMVACGTLLVLVYVFAVALGGLLAGVALPAASPLLGVLGSTTFLGTMAWSEERSKRRKLELLEAAKQRFTDMLAHDLRKRMSSILTSFSLVENMTDTSDPRTRDLVDTIRVSAKRILTQINDLLAIRKIEEGQMILQREVLSLKQLLADSLDEHRPAADLSGVEIRLLGGGEVTVHVDRNVFERVMANLLWNALQHAPEGSGIEVGYSSGGSGVTLYVANRGRPIPVGRQESLFRAFVSERDDSAGAGVPGTGLGLAFCKLAVETHGGSIRLESPWREQGDGVKVVMDLPPAPVMQT